MAKILLARWPPTDRCKCPISVKIGSSEFLDTRVPTAAQLRIGHCGIKDTTLASTLLPPNQEYTDARLLPVRLLGNSSHRDAPWIVEPQGLMAQSLRVFVGYGLLGLFAPSSSLAAFLVSVGGLPGVWQCGSLPHPKNIPRPRPRPMA